jgi:tRNA dimethylallyltransferase
MNNIFVLTGPTGAGKSELGINLAERLGAEIVAMDSMTLYRGMDIGTAKPDRDQRRRVPHHLIDILDPWQSATVAWWLAQAMESCQAIHARGKRVLFVGGTPLYLKALLRGLFQGPPANTELRQRLENEAATLGREALHGRLAQVDPIAAARLHPNDQRRVVRALEVWELTGRPISDWQTQWGDQRAMSVSDRSLLPPLAHAPGSPTVVWLERARTELYARIDARVQKMFAAGLIEEVQALLRLGQPLSKEASQALGYKETFAYLEGRATQEETVRRIQTRTRNFAKRQITWFRHLPECRPVTEELTFTLWAT